MIPHYSEMDLWYFISYSDNMIKYDIIGQYME
jgi:hypothetical protein